ncbi:hypothetical protein ACIQVO_25190 [Streptomyces sp. NPDC101062]|uniref:hypothetical protein n=1 Tax=unclassified Streptomyces TaxID=2593676 RepID=UPI0037F67037
MTEITDRTEPRAELHTDDRTAPGAAPWIAGEWDRIAGEWDRLAVTAGLQGLIGGTGMWHGDSFVGIERAGRFLAGTWAPPAGELGPRPVGDSSWVRFVGRIGAIALRAAAPSTRPPRRAALLNLLEVWAESPFATPASAPGSPQAPGSSVRFRTGLLGQEGPLGLRGEHGAVVAGYWPHALGGGRRFLEIRTGDAATPSLAEELGEVLEAADTPRGWGTPEQLRRLVALVRERGPMAWDAEAVVELSEATGMGRGAAALVLAGNPGASGYYTPFLDNDERRVLGLKTGQGDDARHELIRLRDADRLALLADVLPDDPADLWEPGGPRRLAARTAHAWREQQGVRAVAPVRTWEAAVDLATPPFGNRDLWLSATDLCGLFLAPETAPLPAGADLLNRPPRPEHAGTVLTAWDLHSEWDASRLLDSVFFALPWVYADLPAGDPVRAGAPEVVRILRLLMAGHDHRSELLSTVLGRDGTLYWRGDWVRGEVCDRVMERIAGDALAPGRYESDPRACAPELVRRVADRLGVDEDPAALYLQLLTLTEPTDRNVRRWNAWSPARHRAAVSALLEQELVVADKRPRAGRGVFLPGEWIHAARPQPPMERWKTDLHEVRLSHDGEKVLDVALPTGTLPELFAAAWQRVEAGQGPADAQG